MDVMGVDVYNFMITDDIACNLNASSCSSSGHAGPSLLILNDQGGEVMNVSTDKVSTLRSQMKHHEPIVCFEPGIMSRDCSAGNRAYIDVCSTLRANMGDNQPAVCISLEGNGSRPSHRGDGWSEDGMSFTLNTIEKHAVCYSIGAMNSEGMLSRNPEAGYHETEVARTIDATGSNPAGYQGGDVVLAYGISRSCLKGGNGSDGGMPVGEDIQPGLTANGCSAVAYAVESHPMDSRVNINEEGIVQTLASNMGEGGGQHATYSVGQHALISTISNQPEMLVDPFLHKWWWVK